MRILIITQKIDKNDSILGFMHRWTEEFSKHASKVIALCLFKGKHELPENVDVRSLGKENKVSRVQYVTKFYKNVLPLILFRKVDKIFIHMNEIYVVMLIPLLPIIKLFKIKLIWWKAHGHLGKMSRFARFFVDVVATSSETGFPAKTKKKIVLGQGTDTELFQIPENKKRNNYAIAVGRVSPVKHFEDLIEITKILKGRDVDLNVNIIGVDPNQENPYLKMLQNSVEKEGLNKNIKFIDAIPFFESIKEHEKANIIINTSDTDSMDKVVLESMACGTIPVSSNNAYKELLGKYDLWFEKRDYVAFANRIEEILEMEDVEFRRLQKDMRYEVVTNHNLKNLISKISHL